MNESLEEYILNNFDKSIENGWIRAYYQPVVRSMTGSLCGLEALARWIDPVYGPISTGSFIPVLEESGLIFDLDMIILEWICKDLARQIEKNGPYVPVSFNISRVDFWVPSLEDNIIETVDRYSIPHSLINIEITESAFIEDISRIDPVMKSLQKNGFKILMDDFGTGYSSLGVLNNFPFDKIKIDMSFISKDDKKSRSIMESVVRMSKAIGMQTIAEGVETEKQFRFLRSIGCEKLQGFYFGKAINPDKLIEYCEDSGIAIEDLDASKYYDSLGKIDCITDTSLAVVEDDGKFFKTIYHNKKYEEALVHDGIPSIASWEKAINNYTSPLSHMLRVFADRQLREEGETRSVSFPSEDHYIELTATTIARHHNNFIYQVNMKYVTLCGDKKSANRYDSLIRNLYYLCSDIALVDMDSDCMESIKSSLPDQPTGKTKLIYGLQAVMNEFRDNFIHPDDVERYNSFSDLSTLVQRLDNDKSGYISDYFRSKREGCYKWLRHFFLPVPGTACKQILIATALEEFDSNPVFHQCKLQSVPR